MDSNEASRPDVSVAPISESDYETVLPYIAQYQRFYEAEPDEERNRAFFRRFIAPSEDGLLLGAWHQGRLVGFACLYWTYSSTRAAEVAVMNDLFVDPNVRGLGIGKVLIEASAEAARVRGSRHIEWLTHIDNRGAQRLYEQFRADRSSWFGYEIDLGQD
jgi:GNAT superfamily N-acetyltransferase